ncbi:MAG: hypothetical protein ACC628_24970 [Pirellulaceae bacterium]
MLNLLERHDILTVRDLDDTRDCQLLQIPKLGGSTVQQIGQAVERARRAT